jgi:ATP-binding cassette subfamily B protein
VALDLGALLQRFPALGRLGQRRRVIPVVQQLTDNECGAASLAMVLGYLGREVSLEQLRDLCGGGRDGVNARTIIDAGAVMGLRGRGVKAGLADLPLLEPGTTILHWDLCHFVVFAGLRDDGIEIVDPAVGRRFVGREELDASYTGIALLFEPGDLFRKQERPDPLYPALRQLAVESGLLRRVAVMSLVLQLFGLALPVLTGQVIDRVIPRGDVQLLAVMMIGLAGLVAFRALGQLVRGHLLLHLRTRLDASMTVGFLDHLVSLPFGFFQQRSAGDLLMRLGSNAVVRDRLTATALSGMLDGLMVVAYLAVLLLGNGAMALATLGVGSLDAGLFFFTRRRQRELATRELARESRVHGYEVEMLSAMQTLKSSGCEQRAVERWSNLFVDQLNVQIERDRLGIKIEAVLAAVRSAGPLLILAVGAGEVLGGRLSLGGMLALAAVAGGFLEPLANLVQTLTGLELVRGTLERVRDVLEAAPEQEWGARRPANLKGAITVEAVSFRYHPHAPTVLDGVTLAIEPGQFVALVGRSGSGKTTLANVILGLYLPTAGRVLFDGIDLRQLDLGALRRQVGVVNQELDLFGATVRENIALGDPALSAQAIEAAARLACVHQEIDALPLGYDTTLAERGGAISGGQRQRLALARALVRKPAVLLLDEATSALDAATEREVHQALATLSCTRVVIAHRLSTVRRADLIVVVDGGKIVETGTHQALLERRGAYADLVAAQLEPDQPGGVLGRRRTGLQEA